MLRLRREQPEKFVSRKKVKPPEEKPAAPVPATASPPPVAPAPVPATVSPLPTMPSMPEIKTDNELFGNEEVQPPKIEGANPPPPIQAPPATETPAPPPPESVKKYAVVVWGMIVKICCTIFGDGFKPITLKSETGEVLYDENAEGVKVWWNWLVSIGVKTFSPIVELWVFMISYFTIRFPLIVARFRKKKPAGEQPAPTATVPPAGQERPAPPPSNRPPLTKTPPPESPEQTPPTQPPPATEAERAEAGEDFR